MIYIDPPYNTGRGFTYNDKLVDVEDSYKHSKWISFMNKRLRLAKKLLSKKGIIFISIDDNELSQLKLLCDEIFYEQNLISVLIWSLGSGTSAGHFTRSHEYVICYANDKQSLPWFTLNYIDSNIVERAVKRPSKKNPLSDIVFPKGMECNSEDKIFPKKFGKSEPIEVVQGSFEIKNHKLKNEITLRAAWTMRSQIESWISGKETIDSKGQKVTKFFFKENGVLQYEKIRGTIHPKTMISGFSTKQGTQEIENIFQKRSFEFPKPSNLIKYLLELSTDKNSIIVDFMAGSGTTGHAVLELNKDDGGNRQFILCTNNENSICTDVCLPRLKKIIKGYKNLKGEKVEGLGGNLKYFQTSFVDSEPTDQNKKTIVEKSTEMLCLKEDCFELIKSEENQFKIFRNHNDHFLGIIYYYDGIEPFKKELLKLDKKINTYVFSLSDVVDENDFEQVDHLVRLKPIPSAILNAHNRIFAHV